MQIRAVATLEEVAKDLDAGKAFYYEKGEGIGLYFIDSLLSDIESLRLVSRQASSVACRSAALRFTHDTTLVSGVHSRRYGFYRLLSKRFPFAVYYDVEGSAARVAAVLDMRKDPAWIRQELDRRKG